MSAGVIVGKWSRHQGQTQEAGSPICWISAHADWPKRRRAALALTQLGAWARPRKGGQGKGKQATRRLALGEIKFLHCAMGFPIGAPCPEAIRRHLLLHLFSKRSVPHDARHETLRSPHPPRPTPPLHHRRASASSLLAGGHSKDNQWPMLRTAASRPAATTSCSR